jgi:hypothetical protein
MNEIFVIVNADDYTVIEAIFDNHQAAVDFINKNTIIGDDGVIERGFRMLKPFPMQWRATNLLPGYNSLAVDFNL